jgi:hypothetical protein
MAGKLTFIALPSLFLLAALRAVHYELHALYVSAPTIHCQEVLIKKFTAPLLRIRRWPDILGFEIRAGTAHDRHEQT